MNKATYLKSLKFVSAAIVLQLTSLYAAPVGNWTQVSGSNGTNLEGSSPVLGNGTAESADDQAIYAEFGQVYKLANVGDSLAFSATGVFTVNGAGADQFRFGMYNHNNSANAYRWLGYFGTNSERSASGHLRERSGDFSAFWSSTGATSLTTAVATPGNPSFTSSTYDLSLVYELTAPGTITITWSIVSTGANNYNLSGSFVDSSPLTFDFDRIGLATGGGLNGSQISFSNTDVSFVAIPEASSVTICFGILAAVGILGYRRSKKHSSK